MGPIPWSGPAPRVHSPWDGAGGGDYSICAAHHGAREPQRPHRASCSLLCWEPQQRFPDKIDKPDANIFAVLILLLKEGFV